MLKQTAVALAGFLALTAEGRPQLPAGVSAAACPNYPLCVAEAQDLSIFTPAQQVRERGFLSCLSYFCRKIKLSIFYFKALFNIVPLEF